MTENIIESYAKHAYIKLGVCSKQKPNLLAESSN